MTRTTALHSDARPRREMSTARARSSSLRRLEIARLQGDIDLVRRIRADRGTCDEETTRPILMRAALSERSRGPKSMLISAGGFPAATLLHATIVFLQTLGRR